MTNSKIVRNLILIAMMNMMLTAFSVAVGWSFYMDGFRGYRGMFIIGGWNLILTVLMFWFASKVESNTKPKETNRFKAIADFWSELHEHIIACPKCKAAWDKYDEDKWNQKFSQFDESIHPIIEGPICGHTLKARKRS